MTNLEAIEELKYDCNELGKAIPCDTGWGIAIGSAYDMAIKALEKQIPKKPITHKDTNRADCPVCGATVRGIKEPFGDWCSKCGQALDWGENPKD